MEDVSTWSKDDLEWGLVGCAHDMDHALEMIIDAEDEEEASKAGKEYMDVVLTHDSYLNELNRREKKVFDVRAEMLARPNEWVGAFQLGGNWLKVGFRTDVMYAVATPYWEDSIEGFMPQAFKDELDRCIPIEDVPEEERT